MCWTRIMSFFLLFYNGAQLCMLWALSLAQTRFAVCICIEYTWTQTHLKAKKNWWKKIMFWRQNGFKNWKKSKKISSRRTSANNSLLFSSFHVSARMNDERTSWNILFHNYLVQGHIACIIDIKYKPIPKIGTKLMNFVYF